MEQERGCEINVDVQESNEKVRLWIGDNNLVKSSPTCNPTSTNGTGSHFTSSYNNDHDKSNVSENVTDKPSNAESECIYVKLRKVRMKTNFWMVLLSGKRLINLSIIMRINILTPDFIYRAPGKL